ncbi:MAG: hypothetical protein MJ184_12395 [Treponema sp.]|uniref:hypothetical protein n=1 Tax=Treponema sp. TaxID=166 RepID=UPI00298E1CED|nr:hypothetical protein [Treponema sp.]MCQ2602152.1 hypothetical protein [Treponema sp.]
MADKVKLPDVTRKRMVQLLQLLKAWPDEKITSMEISQQTGWKDSLIRHDFWLLGTDLKGVSNGYHKDELYNTISQILEIEPFGILQNQKESSVAYVNQITGSDSTERLLKNICIVGLGRLGASLLDQDLIDNSIFQIKAGFDSNVYRVEILRSTFPLYPASEMDWVIKREKIEYAVLTVQDSSAQQMCNRLVKAGIKGIVNMTNVVLTVPEGVKIENLSIVNALKLVI